MFGYYILIIEKVAKRVLGLPKITELNMLCY